MELCEQVEACTATAGYVYDHHQDEDDAEELCLLLASLRDAKQALAEVYDAVESYVLKMDTGKSFEVVGLGVVERKRSVSRKAWDNAGLREHVLRLCRENEWDALKVLDECARPSWRANPLRAIGVQLDEWCQEEWGSESIVLPTRNLDERGESFRTDAA
jgi:hypothetical protein